MGSFNTTCFASGQTIAPGDPGFILPIIQASGYDPVELTYDGKTQSLFGIACMSCYPHAFWEPFGGFIEGTYDDYGEFSVADTPINRARLVQLIADLVEKSAVAEEGENQSHDIPFRIAEYVADQKPLLHAGLSGDHNTMLEQHAGSAEFFNELIAAWSYAREAGFEHRLFAKANYHGGLRPVQFAVIHGEAYKGLVAMYATSKRELFDKALAAIQDVLATIKEALAAGETRLAEMARWNRSALFMRPLLRLGSYEALEYPGEAAVIDAALDAYSAGKLDVEGLFAALEPLLDARCVMNGLGRLNLKLSPQVYAGQDYSNAIGIAYAAFVQATSAAVTKLRKERYGDDDEE
jgi:hypothetical protein